MIKIIVILGKDNHTIELESLDALVEELQRVIEDKTRILARKQKLIFKGKTLVSSNSLQQHGLKDGSKILLVATDGVPTTHAARQGASQAAKARHVPTSNVAPKMQGGMGSNLSANQTASMEGFHQRTECAIKQHEASKNMDGNASVQKLRAAHWGKTGIVGIRDEKWTFLPVEVCELGAAAKNVDASRNQIAVLPNEISNLVKLTSLQLSTNLLSRDSIPWPSLAALTGLKQLTLNYNDIQCIPHSISTLTSLTRLSLRCTSLRELPESLSCLTLLEQLEVDKNGLTALPEGVGAMTSLILLDAADNDIAAIPESLSQLKSLRALKLQNNRVRVVPDTLLPSCTNLIILQLQDNPITMKELEDTPGFSTYDGRRKAQLDKQLDLALMSPDDALFQDAADRQQFQRWIQKYKPDWAAKPKPK